MSVYFAHCSVFADKKYRCCNLQPRRPELFSRCWSWQSCLYCLAATTKYGKNTGASLTRRRLKARPDPTRPDWPTESSRIESGAISRFNTSHFIIWQTSRWTCIVCHTLPLSRLDADIKPASLLRANIVERKFDRYNRHVTVHTTTWMGVVDSVRSVEAITQSNAEDY